MGPTTTTTTTTTVPRPVLFDSLVAGNAGVDAATESMRATFGVETCGIVGRVRFPAQEAAIFGPERRCFLDAYAMSRGAALVTLRNTTEGDPMVIAEIVLPEGRILRLHDLTKDNFGDKYWYAMTCRRLTTDLLRAAPDPTLYFADGCELVDPVPLPEAHRALPRFFAERQELPTCGFVLSPIELARVATDCFRAAIASGSPAELVVTEAHDENQIVVHWLRVVRPGSFEMYTTTRSGIGTAATTMWTKQVCTRLEVPAVDVAPLRIVSECRVVETA
jgi:hypothetical protein